MDGINSRISIITPVYNARDTIRKCLDSIMNQTFTDWELILVDDGSTDLSGDICDGYSTVDNRIRVIHKSNGGVSSARQVGLDDATGEYIIHIDSDDWIEMDMLEELYSSAKDSDSDMMICDFLLDIDGNAIYRKQNPSSLQPQVVLNEMFDRIHGSCCNKLVKRSCITRFNVKFPAGVNYCEDVCFNVQLLKHNIKISYLNKAFYHYVQYPNSLTNAFNLKSFFEGTLYVNFLISQLPEDSFPVRRSKELIKKNAFRFSLVPLKQLDKLYPEITFVTGEKLLPAVMYNCAFRGYYWLAAVLRRIYFILR